MWFMVYKSRSINYGADDRMSFGPWAICNCTTRAHPVLQIKKWQQRENYETQCVLIFYEKLPDDVASEVGEIDVGYNEG
jgi:hypothetical protein